MCCFISIAASRLSPDWQRIPGEEWSRPVAIRSAAWPDSRLTPTPYQGKWFHDSPKTIGLSGPREVPRSKGNLSLKSAPRPAARTAWLCGLLIALLFAGWGLHAVGYNNIVDTDGARHAMN